MSFLLDTNVLLFASVEPHRLPANVTALLLSGATNLFVSAVSWYEVELKAQRGRLPRAVADNLADMVRSLRATPLNIIPEYAELAGRLPLVVKDPFDRLIAAQAISTGLTVISSDPAMEALGAGRFWS